MFQKWFFPITFGVILNSLMVSISFAGGVGLGVTRLVYPSEAKQVSVSVRNTDAKLAFLIQPWAEDFLGKKTSDFTITPPLSVLKPKNENSLRVMYTGPTLSKDKETLFWLTVKAVPPVSEAEGKKNVLQLASANRIKVFYRPEGLSTAVQDAPAMLTAKAKGEELILSNPSPYYLTLVNVSINGVKMDSLMVPPKDILNVKLNKPGGGQFKFQTINDYGAQTKLITINY
ncbi:fimbrial chaperone protein [Serratia fonticola]|jgi:P pilus assembly chaperone PapD|uniref:Fimbrial chaperone protein n=1 Tax=Serratia fonticola TaxID=47917 RepID=A0A559T429_SERFO|nr:fimbria/pilus periplasmic chaperone [Serratia fonticola]TQI78139.1 fimbrial chaperone protein [Serratia fonticola]TQI94863.1 fimbrial chaperone protein [Serratia fonticola]TVZ69361.1 fimbrial chaperone protein [Serratia fonticola]